MMMKRSLKKTASRNAPEAVPEKRTKVHAQRKFAQGSPNWTPVKEREREKASNSTSTTANGPETEVKEVLPDQCPKTEDFLTFLCLRGSNLLPPNLDFLSFPSADKKQPGEHKEAPVPADTSSANKVPEDHKLKTSDKPTRGKLLKQPQNYRALHSSFRRQNVNSLATRSCRRLLKQLDKKKVCSQMSKSNRALDCVATRAQKLQESLKLKTRSTVGKIQSRKELVTQNSIKKREKSVGRTFTKEMEPEKSEKKSKKPENSKGVASKPRVQSRTAAKAVKDKTPEKPVTRASNRQEARKSVETRGRTFRSLSSRSNESPVGLKRSSRPSRRTKEAAALCFTLIGEDEEDSMESIEEESDNLVSKISTPAKERKAVPRTPKSAPAALGKRSPAAKRCTILREAARRFTSVIQRSRGSSSGSGTESSDDSEDSQKMKLRSAKSKTNAVPAKRTSLRSRKPRKSVANETTFSALDSSSEEESPRVTRRTKPKGNETKRSAGDSGSEEEVSRATRKRRSRKTGLKDPTTDSSSEEEVPRATRKKNLTCAGSKQHAVDSEVEEKATGTAKKKKENPEYSESEDYVAVPDAPVFYPTEKEFSSPMEYLQKIRPLCENAGICKIVPPATFKPECEMSDSMRFSAYNQYVHRMFQRNGPNVQQLSAIKKHLESLDIECEALPCIGGIEVDLPGLYHAVEGVGGVKKVLEKNLWSKVADLLRIPRTAQDRFSKLDSIYCKYLLSYATLSPEERKKLESKVDPDDDDESVVKGNSIPLSTFYRIARNTQAVWFPNSNPASESAASLDPEEVERVYWKVVTERTSHVCVLGASVDSGEAGYGFPCNKTSKHPWNLKVLTNNPESVLKSLGPVVGATVPTIHLGMLFTACCWYRDPHGLPWIEYLHTGAEKIWYAAAANQEPQLKKAMTQLVPDLIQKSKSLWLPSDTVMIPPGILLEQGVALKRVVQQAGQFIVVWPRSFTASVSTGYTVSESVYFAPEDWLGIAESCFSESRTSCEPTVFSLHHLLWSIATDTRAALSTQHRIVPLLERAVSEEVRLRNLLRNLKLRLKEKSNEDNKNDGKKRRRSNAAVAAAAEEEENECDVCQMNLFFSYIVYEKPAGRGTVTWCLQHALQKLKEKPRCAAGCRLSVALEDDDLDDTLQKMKEMIRTKSQRRQSKN